MVTALLDGYQFVDLGLDGGPYDQTNNPKNLIHTTQGSTLAGAEVAFKPYPPHLGYDPIRRIKKQYVRLDRHSYSLRGAESDDDFVIQTEIVGFAEQTHIWPDWMYRNIAEDVIVPLTKATGVPMVAPRFYGAGEGIVLASKYSPIRFTAAQFRAFTGWCGHQHAPYPDEHWDPGKFLISKAFAYAVEIMFPPKPPAPKPLEEMIKDMRSGDFFLARSKEGSEPDVYAVRVDFESSTPLLRRKSLQAEVDLFTQAAKEPVVFMAKVDFDAIPKLV